MTNIELMAKWDALTPRERDAWIAEEIMGWTGRKTVYEWPDRKKHEYPIVIFATGGKGTGQYETFVDEEGVKIQYGKPHRVHYAPNYSTSISAAWEVVEKMCREYSDFNIGWHRQKWSLGWNFTDYVEDVDSAPEAICKAALLARM